MLLYIVEAKKGCKKKSLNILSLAAYLLKSGGNILQDLEYCLRINGKHISLSCSLGLFLVILGHCFVIEHFAKTLNNNEIRILRQLLAVVRTVV